MKTTTQIKFDKIIKEGFHDLLKPLGFKKKANNFYLQLDELGQIINIQKSQWGTKDEIYFTINTGIFVPEFWMAYFSFQNKKNLRFPTEPECLITKRIGELRNEGDIWYDINEETDENNLITKMKKNIHDFIFPHFEKINSREKLLQVLDKEELWIMPIGRLIVYAEFNQYEKAKSEYEKILNEKPNPLFLKRLKAYGAKYKLE